MRRVIIGEKKKSLFGEIWGGYNLKKRNDRR